MYWQHYTRHWPCDTRRPGASRALTSGTATAAGAGCLGVPSQATARHVDRAGTATGCAGTPFTSTRAMWNSAVGSIDCVGTLHPPSGPLPSHHRVCGQQLMPTACGLGHKWLQLLAGAPVLHVWGCFHAMVFHGVPFSGYFWCVTLAYANTPSA
jgi:hypothetical protein